MKNFKDFNKENYLSEGPQFRKVIGKKDGFRVNVSGSKQGLKKSYSYATNVGVGRVTWNSKGRITYSIPGTGIRWVSNPAAERRKKARENNIKKNMKDAAAAKIAKFIERIESKEAKLLGFINDPMLEGVSDSSKEFNFTSAELKKFASITVKATTALIAYVEEVDKLEDSWNKETSYRGTKRTTTLSSGSNTGWFGKSIRTEMVEERNNYIETSVGIIVNALQIAAIGVISEVSDRLEKDDTRVSSYIQLIVNIVKNYKHLTSNQSIKSKINKKEYDEILTVINDYHTALNEMTKYLNKSKLDDINTLDDDDKHAALMAIAKKHKKEFAVIDDTIAKMKHDGAGIGGFKGMLGGGVLGLIASFFATPIAIPVGIVAGIFMGIASKKSKQKEGTKIPLKKIKSDEIKKKEQVARLKAYTELVKKNEKTIKKALENNTMAPSMYDVYLNLLTQLHDREQKMANLISLELKNMNTYIKEACKYDEEVLLMLEELGYNRGGTPTSEFYADYITKVIK